MVKVEEGRKIYRQTLEHQLQQDNVNPVVVRQEGNHGNCECVSASAVLLSS